MSCGPAARPAAEVVADVGLATELVATQHPDLLGPIRPVGGGWDNAVFRLGSRWALRLPRREQAVGPLRAEQRWLPVLAAGLQVPIPVPVRTGRAGSGYPWPWSVVPWSDGIEGAAGDAVGRSILAQPLAEFLLALHRPAPDGPEVPHSPVRGVPLSVRDASVRANLGRLPAGFDRAALTRIWSEAVAAPAWSGPPVWVHGDLHPGNLIMDGGRLAAIIDFGDLTAGDPATDLATAWLTFDPAGRAAFRDRLAAGEHGDESMWRRARGWAVANGSALAVYSADDPRMAALGRQALTAVLDD